MRGDVFRLRPTPHVRGHEQRGERYAVVVQASQFDHLSTWLVVPTSTRARATVFRPEIEVPGRGRTLALCDGLTAVDPQARLSEQVGRLAGDQMVDVDIAIQGLLDLDHGR
jgi:mRNA interferase MazF